MIIASKELLSLNKYYAGIIILGILSLDSFYYYTMKTNPVSLELTNYLYIENNAFKQAVDYVVFKTSNNDLILTNEPYALLSYPIRLPISVFFERHYTCPNNMIKYLVVFNSSKKESNIDLANITRLPFYKLEKTLTDKTNTVYIFNVTGSLSCPMPSLPFVKGFYLSDIMK